MSMFKLVFFASIAFLSGVAIFVGVVMMVTSLQSGAIMLAYTSGGRVVDETVTRAADAARFWRLLAAMGLAPAILGATALWYSVRKMRTGQVS